MPTTAEPAAKCPRCNGPKELMEKCRQCGLKPGYSKCRRLQLCYGCNRYWPRSYNLCPKCNA